MNKSKQLSDLIEQAITIEANLERLDQQIDDTSAQEFREYLKRQQGVARDISKILSPEMFGTHDSTQILFRSVDGHFYLCFLQAHDEPDSPFAVEISIQRLALLADFLADPVDD